MKKLLTLVIFMSICLLSFGTLAGAADWKVPGDFATIQEAIDSPLVVAKDDILVIGPGNFAGANVTKEVDIKGVHDPVIDSGPAHSSGLIMGFPMLAGSDGATIRHFIFKVDLAIMNRAKVENVTITHNVFLSAIQAISNWSGNSWNITHNIIQDLRTRNGGGIGILIGDRFGGVVFDNFVAHNDIIGTLTSMPGELGGYDGSGIVLYADFRYGQAGALCLAYNRITKNKIWVKDGSDLVNMIALELTDTRFDEGIPIPYPVIFGNSLTFNDLRGTPEKIVLTPDTLEEFNIISKNREEWRGKKKYGTHPHHCD